MNLKTSFDVADQPHQYMEGECPYCRNNVKIPIKTQLIDWQQAYEDMIKENNQLIESLKASIRKMHQEICDLRS